jgi:concanavalin A-like lectin/glucanase superfamily protein
MTDSAGHHDGAMRNVATGVAGFSGTAFGFNGASSYGTVANATDLSAVSHNVTLTMHMRATALPPPTIQDWDLIRSSGGYYDGDEYKMEYAPDGTAHCSFKGDGATGYKEVASSAARPLDDGRWHTVQCVKTQTQVKTVVDGTVYAQSAVIGNIVLTQGLIVGAHPNAAGQGGSEFYNGTLDEASLAFSKPSP